MPRTCALASEVGIVDRGATAPRTGASSPAGTTGRCCCWRTTVRLRGPGSAPTHDGRTRPCAVPLYSGTTLSVPCSSRPRPCGMSNQYMPLRSRSSTCRIVSLHAELGPRRGRNAAVDAAHADAARRAEPERAIGFDGDAVDRGELSAVAGMRSKSRPVQRATPPLVPTHSAPSGATTSCPTSASGRLRGSPARGMKRVTLPSRVETMQPAKGGAEPDRAIGRGGHRPHRIAAHRRRVGAVEVTELRAVGVEHRQPGLAGADPDAIARIDVDAPRRSCRAGPCSARQMRKPMPS